MSSKLIEEVRRAAPELSVAAAKSAVDAVFAGVNKLTGEGERVTVRGFGTFVQKQRAERTGRNPRTGEQIRIAARDELTFKQSK